MKVIISTIGSAGDLHPFYQIAFEMKKRGHEILFLSTSYYEEEIENFGFPFKSIGSKEGWQKLIDMFDPENISAMMEYQMNYIILGTMKINYDIIKSEQTEGETVTICSPMMPGPRIARDTLGIPMATMNLAPSTFRSLMKPPRIDAQLVPESEREHFHKNLFESIDTFVHSIVRDPINEYRKELKLPPVEHIFNWLESPDKIIGLFPNWYAEKQQDWPEQATLTTFPLFDGGADTHKILPQDLITFLNHGNAPIVFTPGSHFNKAVQFYQTALEACTALNERAVFLAKFPEQVPKDLPNTIFYCSYAELSELLPKSKLIVHHGGIGTLAQGLKAGIPHIVVPWGLDQFNNSLCLQEMGVGDEVPYDNITPEVLIEKIKNLLSSTKVIEACNTYKNRLETKEPVKETCDILERMVSQ